MKRLELLKELTYQNDSKILFWIFDGIGGLPDPETGKTEMETARIPHLDAFARRSSCGGLIPHGAGVAPGSGPGHLSLFGYPLDAFDLPRGVLEVLGAEGAFRDGQWVGPVDPRAGDLAMRGNFATLKETGDGPVIADRRAGKPPTEENRRVCEKLSAALQVDGVEVFVFPGEEHRFALLLRGDGLAGGLTDADPQKEGLPPAQVEALNAEARRGAAVVNEVVAKATEILQDEARINTVLLRGIGTPPAIPTLEELYGIRCAAIATYPMYRGIARLVGMDVLPVEGLDHAEEVRVLEEHFQDYDFFYLHIKETDSYGHTGEFDKKVGLFEECDPLFERALGLGFDVVAVSGDHCTPCVLGDHSWHPIPTALWSKNVMSGGTESFDERQVLRGTMGKVASRDLIPLALAEAGRLKKFGA